MARKNGLYNTGLACTSNRKDLQRRGNDDHVMSQRNDRIMTDVLKSYRSSVRLACRT